MKVVLVGPELEENLSIRYLAGALTRAGHECAVVPFNDGRETRAAARAVLREKPGLVGLSLVAQRRFADCLGLANSLRRKGFKGHITAGGHFASLRAREILGDAPALDSILHHDGEERIVALAGALESLTSLPADIDGVSWRASDGAILRRAAVRVAEVDSLASPLRRRPDRALGLPRAPIISSRGCAGSCSFCSIHAWHKQVPGGRLRFRSPKKVADEMIALNREHGVRVFIFHDDDFIHPDPREARARCGEILETAERGIGAPFAFVIKCRPDDVDETLFRYLKSKGLVRVFVGIETHSELGIRTLNRRTTPETNERALETLRKLGIYACFNLLIFHPDTTIEELDENLGFLSRNLDLPFDVGRTVLYAHSALEERMVRENRAIGDYRGFDYRIADPRAAAAFDLFAEILWDRHFAAHSILHRIQDTGLRMSLLARFHPETASSDLRARAASLVSGVNSDTVEHVRRLVEAARDGTARDNPLKLHEFIESMRCEVDARIRRHAIAWAALTLEIEGRALLARTRPIALSTLTPAPRILGRIATAVPCIGLALCTLGCDNQVQPCDPLPPSPIHFSTDIEPYLNKTCSTSGCHSAVNPEAGLVLVSGQSYDNLVNVPSEQVPGMDRVKPNRTDSSYVVYKMEGTQQNVGGSGERMPKGKTGDRDYSFIGKLRSWIMNGARRD